MSVLSIKAGHPDKGCPAFCRYTGLQQPAYLVFYNLMKWLFLVRPNDNKPVFRHSYNASIELNRRVVCGASGVRRFSHLLHQRRIRRTPLFVEVFAFVNIIWRKAVAVPVKGEVNAYTVVLAVNLSESNKLVEYVERR